MEDELKHDFRVKKKGGEKLLKVINTPPLYP